MGNGFEYHVTGIRVHPNFENDTSKGDVALLMLEKPLVFSKYSYAPNSRIGLNKRIGLTIVLKK